MRNYSRLSLVYCLQLFIVFGLGLYLYFFGQWNVQTNLLSLLPETQQNPQMQKAEQALFAKVEKQALVAIAGDEAMSAYQALNALLIKQKMVSLVSVTRPSVKQISDFYLPYRHNFLSRDYLTKIDDSTNVSSFIASQLTQVSDPFVNYTLADDPRLLLADYLKIELNTLINVEFTQGVPSVKYAGKQYLLLNIDLNSNGFSVKKSQKIASFLQNKFQEIKQKYQVDIIFSGAVFHTAASSRQAEHEISNFGVLSLFGVIFLLIFAFRTLKPLIYSLLVMLIAMVYGATAMLYFFEQIHLLTLVFATTLIGVVIDYCFHAFTYASTEHHKNKNLSKILTPLFLGFITTTLGYFTLFVSPLTLLSQVAVFMIFGLLGALMFVFFLLKNNCLTGMKLADKPLGWSKKITVLITPLTKKGGHILVAFSTALFVLLLFKPLSFNDDVRLLNSSPELLVKNEVKMAKILAYQKHQRVVLWSNSSETLLQQQEQLITRLKSNQTVLTINSVSGILPSAQKQYNMYQTILSAENNHKFDEGLAITGLTDPIEKFTPLTYDEILNSPMQSLIENYITTFYLDIDKAGNQIIGYVTWLDISGAPLNNDNLLMLASYSKSKIYDKANEISMALALYRHNLLLLLFVAVVVVALMMLGRYGIKNGFLGVITIVASATASLICSQIILYSLNIFNVLAVLLIFALAIDYVIFYQEQGVQPHNLLALFLSAASSILVFGMLSFSITPAVQSFGLTVMFGIVFIVFFAPLTTCFQRHNI